MARNRSYDQFFVCLRQFSAQRDDPIAEAPVAYPPASRESGGRLVEDQDAWLRRAARSNQRFLALALVGGKPTNRNSSLGQARRGQRRDRRARPGNRLDPDAGAMGCRRPGARPGSEMTGVPASDTSAIDSPAVEPSDERRRFLLARCARAGSSSASRWSSVEGAARSGGCLPPR